MVVKKILGLDLGTNSIGWALIQKDDSGSETKILGAGSRIIPMSQDILKTFGSGASYSETADRTRLRTSRRLLERFLLRRERLHRVLHLMGFLPEHFAAEIDFVHHPGQFLPGKEPKLAYRITHDNGKKRSEFIFRDSFLEMLEDFRKSQPELLASGQAIPQDWLIYYLRKKALSKKISKEELAWVLLQFNQKRGYNQLRGEDAETDSGKKEEFLSLKVVRVEATNEKHKSGDTWYNVHLENGMIYRRSSSKPLEWEGSTRDFIVTTELDELGNPKKDKNGNARPPSFRSPGEDDWMLRKKKTEYAIEQSGKTLGEYIYDSLLSNPQQRIIGQLVRTIERKFYKTELRFILEQQKKYHPELVDQDLYLRCVKHLYPKNDLHREGLSRKNFTEFFINDILFYQRPLKSKRSSVEDCSLAPPRLYKDKDGNLQSVPLKCIPRSHPAFQEFRLWKFLQDVRIYQNEAEVNGKLEIKVDVTSRFLPDADSRVQLFDWLNDRKEIDQKTFLKYPGFGLKKEYVNYSWNFLPDKQYPCNETRAQLLYRLGKVKSVPENFLTYETESALWHILYSVTDKTEVAKALRKFARKHQCDEDSFVSSFEKVPVLEKAYGSYSLQAISRLMVLMRTGKYWNANAIDIKTRERIDTIIDGVADDTIPLRVREKLQEYRSLNDFHDLPQWLAQYVVYGKHAESGSSLKWRSPAQIELIGHHELRNPIVEKVINESLKVVRDVWNYYGHGKEDFFDEIHVELGREMKNNSESRKRITEQITKNESTNLRLKALLAEMKNDPSYIDVRPHSPSQLEILKIYEDDVLSVTKEIPDEILKIAKNASPTSSELTRYKLWLEQKYQSPYTGQVIQLSRLFTSDYEIEHIIPQALFLDDSLNNKVICEAAVNSKKNNRTAWRFISEDGGTEVMAISGKQPVRIFKADEFEQFVKEKYAGNPAKAKRLLSMDVPESFIQRQLNDTRYISKVVMQLLSNIVRCEGEKEYRAASLISTTGSVTSRLRQDWGLNQIWNEMITPRFERLNQIQSKYTFGAWVNKAGKRVFQIDMPLELQKDFDKKRIDHRHHALDAIVIACTTANHVNYMNNQSALDSSKKPEARKTDRNDLRKLLCEKVRDNPNSEHGNWVFRKPWDSFTQDTRHVLQSIIVSFYQRIRLQTKSVNYYEKWHTGENGHKQKIKVRQEKGDNRAARKSLHKDTVAARVTLQLQKEVALATAIKNPENIADKSLKKQIRKMLHGNMTPKNIEAFFRDRNYLWNDRPVNKVKVFYMDAEQTASRTALSPLFNSAFIDCVTDSGIRKILWKHLARYNEVQDGKVLEHPELAFSPEGIEAMNKNIVELNDGQKRCPILKVRTAEPLGNKYPVGTAGNKSKKYVEADKGTNLFFAIYSDKNGKRIYETISLNIAIERSRQRLSPVPETDARGNHLLFYLSPNELVYVPSSDEISTGLNAKTISPAQVYKMVSSSGPQCFFVRNDVAFPIWNKTEFGPNNKQEKSIDGLMIKEVCQKIKINRLGQLELA